MAMLLRDMGMAHFTAIAMPPARVAPLPFRARLRAGGGSGTGGSNNNGVGDNEAGVERRGTRDREDPSEGWLRAGSWGVRSWLAPGSAVEGWMVERGVPLPYRAVLR